MIKILVCVKQIPDVDAMQIDPETGNLIRANIPMLLNPLDANALSAAMKVKEDCGGEVTLVTMGPPSAEAILRECLAVGADKAILVTDRAFGSADTLATSYTIASAVKAMDQYDMIFCGKESLDGATGQFGVQLAERLDVAQITGTLLIHNVDETARTVVAERELERGTETLKVSMPCLFTVEKTNYPARVPGLKGKMMAKKAKIVTMTADDIVGLNRTMIGVCGSPTKTVRTYPPDMPEPGMIIDEGSVQADVSRLMTLISD